MLKEFRDFVKRGNVLDLAIGVIVGGAFGKIVDSMVKDLIMPLISKLVGNVDYSNLFVIVGSVPATYRGGLTYAELVKAGIPVLAYGNFITVVLNFLILAWIIFLMIKVFNRLHVYHLPDAKAPEEIQLLREIRDALQQKE